MLDETRKRVKAPSDVETIRRALTFYSLMTGRIESGDSVVFRQKDGREESVIIA